MGETIFPQRMTLNAGVLPPPVKAISCSYPYRSSNTTCHNYLFYNSAIEFALGVGRQIDSAARQACFASNSLHPIIVTDYPKIFGITSTGSGKKLRMRPAPNSTWKPSMG